jgi:hypothetical protein
VRTSDDNMSDMQTYDDEDLAKPWQGNDESGVALVGYARVAGRFLSFHVRGHFNYTTGMPEDLLRPPSSRDSEEDKRLTARVGIARAEAVEAAIAARYPGLPVRAVARILPPDTTGPGGDIPPILAMVLSDDPVGRIADYVALGVATLGLIKWIGARKGSIDAIDDGIAMLIAASAIEAQTGARDLTLAAVQRLSAADPDPDFGRHPVGFVVGFRDDDNVYEVAISLQGVPGPVTTTSLSHFRIPTTGRNGRKRG